MLGLERGGVAVHLFILRSGALPQYEQVGVVKLRRVRFNRRNSFVVACARTKWMAVAAIRHETAGEGLKHGIGYQSCR